MGKKLPIVGSDITISGASNVLGIFRPAAVGIVGNPLPANVGSANVTIGGSIPVGNIFNPARVGSGDNVGKDGDSSVVDAEVGISVGATVGAAVGATVGAVVG